MVGMIIAGAHGETKFIIKSIISSIKGTDRYRVAPILKAKTPRFCVLFLKLEYMEELLWKKEVVFIKLKI